MHLFIVIPFFQRESGILSRAVASVVAQQGVLERADVASATLLIVDDASPVSADAELSGIAVPDGLVCPG
ncbi:MAG: hypothetical protein MZV65_22360 [Chromatiales bacterium]|nr:hypothetical protein [Chromatiales bacterium]